MNKYKIILLLCSLILINCKSDEDFKSYYYDRANKMINDTITLSDGHLYYYLYTYRGKSPVHSQYCKNHNLQTNN